MSDDGTVAKLTKLDMTKACVSRGCVFAYDIIVVIGLTWLAYIYVKNLPGLWLVTLPPGATPPAETPFVEIALRAIWFGALGGIVISLKGVYDHCCGRGEWDDCFNLWHFGRPISGGLTGLITLVLLLATNPKGTPSEPVVFAIAFIFGTQERRFFNFLSEVAALVVRVPNEDKTAGLKGGDIQPASGKANDVVLITGQGFAQGATVTIGANKLANVVVSKDGTTIVGTLPAGPAAPGDGDIHLAGRGRPGR